MIADGAASIEVAIGVYDKCVEGCGPTEGTCHTHAPLIDNVRLLSYPDVIMVTNTDEGGPGSFFQAIADADASINTTTILFDIPGTGPFSIDRHSSYPMPISATLLIDGTSQPGYAGTPIVWIHGPGDASPAMLQVTAPNTSITGLKLFATPNTFATGGGLSLESDNAVVQGCTFADWGTAILVSGNNNVIGGVHPGEPNTITGSKLRAILVNSGTGNPIRGNSIQDAGSNNGFGIDLTPVGITPNDANEVDTGPNERQNFPILRSYDPLTGVVSGVMPAKPYTTYAIDIFYSSECDPTGYGEGEWYLATAQVTTGVLLDEPFSVNVGSLNSTGAITATATDPMGNTSEFSPCIAANGVATSVADGGAPRLPALRQNRPNPFNPATMISYDVPAGGATMTLRIYDVSGRLVRTLVDGRRLAGTHNAVWDGRNDAGAPVSSGIYFYQMIAGSFVEARRMVLLK
jgi:FlgD Ig-like domain